MTKNTSFHCNICSSNFGKHYMIYNSYNILTCQKCFHIQVYPTPSDDILMSLYQNDGSDSFYGNSCSKTLLDKSYEDKTFLLKYYSERLDILVALCDTNSKILDFGCTNGVFVKSIIDSGYENAFGYDIANTLVEEGKKNGLQLHTGDINVFSEKFNHFFDFITSYHVFEHLPDPKKTLSILNKILKQNAHIYINVPHINSLQVRLLGKKSAVIDPPFHLHYFTKKSISKLFIDENFEILKISTPFWEKNTDTFLELNGVNSKLARFLRYLVSPLRGIIKSFSLGGTITIIAKKK